jgi:hypothetical protein
MGNTGTPTNPRRRYRLITWVILFVAILAGVTGNQTTAGNDAIELYNEDLFFEKVKALNDIKIGATEAEVIKAVGEPAEKTVLSDGSRIFIYRVRLYKGPEPFAASPRQIYLTSKTRIVFNKDGRVTSSYREP